MKKKQIFGKRRQKDNLLTKAVGKPRLLEVKERAEVKSRFCENQMGRHNDEDSRKCYNPVEKHNR